MPHHIFLFRRINIRIPAIFLISAQFIFALSLRVPDFPLEPTSDEVLAHNELEKADENSLLKYAYENAYSIGHWLPELREQEEKRITAEYVRRLNTEFGRIVNADKSSAKTYWETATKELTKKRLTDPRRIVDSVLRKLGQKGSAEAIPELFALAARAERPWVAWKSLASVQEILPRVDPGTLHYKVLRRINVNSLAPLLRDIDQEIASNWAWTLWEQRKNWLGVSFRRSVPLKTRLWLARAYAADHPNTANEVFEEGLSSHDAALRTVTEMFIRSGIGGSISYGTSPEKLLEEFSEKPWNLNRPLWEVLPIPLDQPLPRENYGGRVGRIDMIWLSKEAEVERKEKDVWPMVYYALPNGLFYSRIGGGRYPGTLALTSDEGDITARFPQLRSYRATIGNHGGLWGLTTTEFVTELLPDGTVLWQCPPTGSRDRVVAPIGTGRVLVLGYNSLQCLNRRGDVLWKCSLKDLDDPRSIFPISEKQFLVSCTNSIGLVNTEGKYTPVLEGLKSTSWVRYHPTKEWIILDGGNRLSMVFNPSTKTVTGSFDLDDGGEKARSKYSTNPSHFPE